MFPRSRSLFAAAAAVLLIGSACAQIPAGSLPFQAGPRSAQPPPPPSNPSPNRSPYPLGTQEQPPMTDPLVADKKFVKEAAEASLAQIELGEARPGKGLECRGERVRKAHGR